jgi:hypothetical protein
MRSAHIRAAMAMALMGPLARQPDIESFEVRPENPEPPRNRPRRARVAPGTPLHEQPHPLYGEEPENGKERALVREWEQAKRRAALYGPLSTNTSEESDNDSPV